MTTSNLFMKVALVHDFLVRMGGAERVLKVLADMYPDAPIYTLLYDENVTGEVFPRERVRTSFLQKFPRFLRKRHRYLSGLMPLAMERFDFSRFDAVISSSSAFAHGILTGTDTKHVCYCHSPMRYAWDWTHEYLKENNITGVKLYFARTLTHKLRMWDKVAADRPDVYIANSKNTLNRVRKYYRSEATVVYPPVDVNRFTVSRESEDFYLIVSTLTAFKRIDIAVKAFNALGKRLVIVGDGVSRESLEAMAEQNIEFVGFKKDDEVADYMARCKAFVFAGEEDFGIAPVEAMACGKPVIAYGRGGLLESVVAGETGVFFYELDAEALSAAVQKFERDGVALGPDEIRKYAERFSVDAFKKGVGGILNFKF